MDADPKLVDDSGELAECCEQARATGCIAFDLEFVSADRYVPDLCVFQLGWQHEGEIRSIAADALSVDLAPAMALVEDESVEAVAHAPKQDLQLLARRHGVQGKNIVDSQIAAAFAGLGEQLGYAKLCKAVLNLDIDKGAQFTDWSKRPLSRRQIKYALGDVEHLWPAWQRLKALLDERKRLAWVLEESAALVDACAVLPQASQIYLGVSGVGGLKGKALGSLQALAAWREELALKDNTPPAWIVPDPAMIEMSRRQSKNHDAMRKVRGVGSATVRKYGDQILQAIAAGAKNPPNSALSKKVPLTPVEQINIGVCQAIVQARCMDEEMPPRFVGPRAEVEALVRAHSGGNKADASLAKGWRWEFVGETLWAWMSGELSLSLGGDSASGMRIQ